MGDKKRLARAGLEVMDRLDLPGELAAGVGRMELVGTASSIWSSTGAYCGTARRSSTSPPQT